MDAQIARLLGTTKETIAKVRERSHWNSANIKPHNPILLGLVKQADLDAAVKRAQRRIARENAGKGGGIEDEEAVHETGNVGFAETSSPEEQPEIDHDAMMRTLG